MIEIRGKGSGLMYIIGLSESGGRLLERIFSSLRGLGLNAARRFAIRPRPLETTTALAQSSQAKIALPYEQRQPSQLSDNVGHGCNMAAMQQKSLSQRHLQLTRPLLAAVRAHMLLFEGAWSESHTFCALRIYSGAVRMVLFLAWV